MTAQRVVTLYRGVPSTTVQTLSATTAAACQRASLSSVVRTARHRLLRPAALRLPVRISRTPVVPRRSSYHIFFGNFHSSRRVFFVLLFNNNNISLLLLLYIFLFFFVNFPFFFHSSPYYVLNEERTSRRRISLPEITRSHR